ncbi:unnamed protein product [Nezara viridula]|uniref:CUB domain-containing protein n=1 Tax=Nezara viridula TaxID=85310 RepID=A0A9P0HUJ0_NEZVI|nr:unnamed protein product [Nezara viridula]
MTASFTPVERNGNKKYRESINTGRIKGGLQVAAKRNRMTYINSKRLQMDTASVCWEFVSERVRGSTSVSALLYVERCSAGDYLVVYPSGTDGAVNEESYPLGRLCGSEAINLYSSGPSIVLEFHTEVNIRNSTGFNGKFTFIQAGNTTVPSIDLLIWFRRGLIMNDN